MRVSPEQCMSIRPSGAPFARTRRGSQAHLGQQDPRCQTYHLPLRTNNANARATTVGGTVLLYDASQRKEKVKYRSEVVDRRRKRDVGSEVHVYRRFVEGRGELGRERGWRFLGVRTKHAKPRHHLSPALPSPRAARLPLPATPTTLSVFRRTHQAAQRPPYDGGWLETENKYLSEVPFSTVFLHRTSSPIALISASQQRR